MKKLNIGIYVILMAGILLVSGCHHERDLNYLVRHPAALQQMVSQCEALGDDAMSKNDNCTFVRRIDKLVFPLAQQLQDNPPHFGQQILSEESTLAALQAKLADVKLSDEARADLQKQVAQLQEKIQVMLALVGMQEGF